MTKETDLQNDLLSVIKIGNYRGVYVEKLIGGFRALGKVVSTMKEVDSVIDAAIESLGGSIKNINNVGSKKY